MSRASSDRDTSSIELLAAPTSGTDFAENLDRVATAAALPPFSLAAEGFIADFSRTILRSRAMRDFPELMALAHSMRPARIAEARDRFATRNRGRFRRAAGLAFHIAPANVDSIFVHSWFLSMLGGNANVVRLSSRQGDQAAQLIQCLVPILAAPEHSEIRARTLLLSYGRDDAVSAAISQRCRLRVVWGGDASIAHIRSLPLEPRAREITFADRFSLALLDSGAVIEASEETLKKLARDFYNDAFWFDQNACSSPRLICWLGTAASARDAQRRFWCCLAARLSEVGWRLPPSRMIARMTAVDALAASGNIRAAEGMSDARAPIRLSLARLDEQARLSHPGGGVFYEMVVPNLDAMDRMLSPRDQTLGVFGVSHAQLSAWLTRRNAQGIDRVVPVGKALDFDMVWDGQDLLDLFTNEVTILHLPE